MMSEFNNDSLVDLKINDVGISSDVKIFSQGMNVCLSILKTQGFIIDYDDHDESLEIPQIGKDMADLFVNHIQKYQWQVKGELDFIEDNDNRNDLSDEDELLDYEELDDDMNTNELPRNRGTLMILSISIPRV
ncbi:hypothetical protein QAD02_007970 [Eretmocerus hayati]|uniref:Uncharacterized protein n=1 Tax=Eretmocerus hayati TaxID=131215 RepID=A0ACC2N566_9HYME|nr:hypothetical protein QAD02_007970 [Eretmocerus hayati]